MLRALGSLIIALALASCASRKPYNPYDGLQPTIDAPECSSEPAQGDWTALREWKRETTFDVQVSGTLGFTDTRDPQVIDLRVATPTGPWGCSGARSDLPPMKLRLVDDRGEVTWIEPPPEHVTSAASSVRSSARTSNWQRFCFDVPMQPAIQSVALVLGERVLANFERPRRIDMKVRSSVRSPDIAIAYRNEATRYATATMQVQSDRALCAPWPIAQRADSGFLGLGGACWSYWRNHFEREGDACRDHMDHYFATPSSRGPAQLLVTDLFQRSTFKLGYSANCGSPREWPRE